MTPEHRGQDVRLASQVKSNMSTMKQPVIMFVCHHEVIPGFLSLPPVTLTAFTRLCILSQGSKVDIVMEWLTDVVSTGDNGSQLSLVCV